MRRYYRDTCWFHYVFDGKIIVFLPCDWKAYLNDGSLAEQRVCKVIYSLCLHIRSVCVRRSECNHLTTTTASHTHYWIVLQFTGQFCVSVLSKINPRPVVTWNDASNCKIHVLMQLCHSPTTRRSSWENSPTAPTCWTRRPAAKRGSAS